jgi:plasmid stability protein
MAKHATKDKEASEPSEEKKRAVRCELPESLHRELRILAARWDMHMSQAARQIITERLEAERGKR